MHKYVLSFLLCSTLLSGEEKIPYLTSECDTLALVDGVVNVYNGKLVQIDQDIKINGSDPLEMTRYYDGGHHFDSEFGYGIGCSYPALLLFTGGKDNNYVTVELRQGLEVLCEVKKQKKIYAGGISKAYYKSGYTNNCEALLNGESSLASLKVELDAHDAIVTLGDGTKRYYAHFSDLVKTGSYYRLYHEERSNGNHRYFTYTKNSFPFNLKRIWTTNHDESLTLNWIDFSYKNNAVTVSASNGQEAHYSLKLEKGKAEKGNLLSGFNAKYQSNVLVEASSDHSLSTHYETIKHTHSLDTLFSLSKVKLPNDRFIAVDYDSKERVFQLKASGSDKVLYTFDYHKDYTNVVDARGAKKAYQFNKRRLAKLIETHRSQNYTWDDKGQLFIHTIDSPSGQQMLKREYKYDDKGNVKEIKATGCITNINSLDCAITTFTYGDRNTLVTEKHNDALQYTYSYVPNTNLLSKKLTIFEQAIVEREFYEYDKNAILIRKIVDDGSSSDVDDLTNVTFRLITEIKPQLNPKLPGLTLPHWISEWYVEKGQKHLLKKTERLYCHGDLLAEERITDATNTYRYNLLYEYNQRRELIRSTNALGEVTFYAYDDNGNKIYEENLGSNKKVHYAYDLADRLKEEKEEHLDKTLNKTYGYDAIGNRISETDIYAQTNTYEYDLASRQVSSCDPLGYSEISDYDVFGSVTKAIDKDNYTTSTCNNIFGKPLEITHPDGTTEKYAYNLQGHLIQEWKRDGTNLRYQPDYKGRIKKADTYASDGTLLKSVSYRYKGPNLIEEVDALGHMIRYLFDGAGRKKAKMQGGNTTLYDYDSLGHLAKTISDNHIAITEYDFLDRVLEERIEDSVGNIFRKVQYEYDRLGNQTFKNDYIDATQVSKTQTLYNSQSLPILIIDPLGFEKKITYRQTDHLKKVTRDALGRQVIEIYDPLQRVSETKHLSKEGALLAHSTFAFDARGHQIKRLDDIIVDGNRIGSYEVLSSYDEMGQKIQETEQNNKITKWTYREGRLDTLTNPDGIILRHVYDSYGRLQEQNSSDGSIHYHFTYDLNNNLLSAEDLIHHILITRSYDALLRVTYEKQASGLEFIYSYDHLNRLVEMRFRDESVIYKYSPTTLIGSSRFNSGRELFTSTLECDWRGKITSANLGNAIISYKWDAVGRCKQIDAPSYSQTLIYDPVGNLIQTNVQDALDAYETNFRYDELNQLVSENSSVNQSTYTYDSLQNRRTKNQNNYQIDACNHLRDDGEDQYSYDPNGRRMSKADEKYTYDALGHLVTFEKGEKVFHYKYDPLGRRIKCISSDSITDYLYQFDTEIGSWEGGQLKQFRMIHNKHATFTVELDGELYVPIRNHRGDIVQLLNEQSEPISTYRYDAFGNFSHEGIISPWLFSGQRYEQAVGLYHFDKRDYDPSIGRWITPDPLGFSDGPNLFAYVHNNPLIYVDPYGLWREETRDFFHAFSRGAIDDTTWNASSRILGEYKPATNFERAGHYSGTAASMIASVFYGGAEARVVKGAYQLFRRTMLKAPVQSAKTAKTSYRWLNQQNKTSTQKVFEQTKKLDPMSSKNMGNIENSTNLARELNFTNKTTLRMVDPDRTVPRHILAHAIQSGRKSPDPDSAVGAIKIAEHIYRNNKRYELNIIYKESDKTILHFHYDKG